MSPKASRIVTILAIIAAVGGLSMYQSRASRFTEMKIDGTIKHVDATARTATLEFRSPRNGKLIEMKREIPPECRITINGSAADLSQLVAGDHAQVDVRWDSKNQSAIPLGLTVDRPIAEASESPGG